MTEFGRLNPDGTYTKERDIRQSDVMKCPHLIIVASHYRPDGSCRCSNAVEREKMITHWGYAPDNFINIPLVD